MSHAPTVTHAEAHAQAKDASYDAVVIPEPFPAVETVVDEDRVRAHAFAQGVYGSWYVGERSSAHRSRPLAVAKYSLALLLQSVLLSLEPLQER